MNKIRVTHRWRMAAAIVGVAGMTLAASAFPATAATTSRGLASPAITDLTTTNPAATNPVFANPVITNLTTTTNPIIAPGPAPGAGTTVGSSSGTTSGATKSTGNTVVTTGQTLTYNEGATGYCTWWAIYQFHAYTKLYPDFFDPANDGNAGYWGTDAAYDGWTVTNTPRVDSIAVFPPGVNGAESDGHVAWVTGVSGSQITMTEMNGPAGWNEVDTRTLTPGPGVSYILAP